MLLRLQSELTVTVLDSVSCDCRQTECRIRQLHKQSSSRAVRVAAAAGPAADPVQGQQPEQAAVEQRSVTLRKPVGVVFAQNKTGPVFVEELTAGGNADKSGLVQVKTTMANGRGGVFWVPGRV